VRRAPRRRSTIFIVAFPGPAADTALAPAAGARKMMRQRAISARRAVRVMYNNLIMLDRESSIAKQPQEITKLGQYIWKMAQQILWWVINRIDGSISPGKVYSQCPF
jgi:hypothetical protein